MRSFALALPMAWRTLLRIAMESSLDQSCRMRRSRYASPSMPAGIVSAVAHTLQPRNNCCSGLCCIQRPVDHCCRGPFSEFPNQAGRSMLAGDYSRWLLTCVLQQEPGQRQIGICIVRRACTWPKEVSCDEVNAAPEGCQSRVLRPDVLSTLHNLPQAAAAW